MKKRRLLFLKAVAYDSMNQEIRDYLEPFLDEKTDLEVRSIAKGTSHMEYHFYQAVNQGEILRGILQAEKDGFDACIISCFALSEQNGFEVIKSNSFEDYRACVCCTFLST